MKVQIIDNIGVHMLCYIVLHLYFVRKTRGYSDDYFKSWKWKKKVPNNDKLILKS